MTLTPRPTAATLSLGGSCCSDLTRLRCCPAVNTWICNSSAHTGPCSVARKPCPGQPTTSGATFCPSDPDQHQCSGLHGPPGSGYVLSNFRGPRWQRQPMCGQEYPATSAGKPPKRTWPRSAMNLRSDRTFP